MAVCSKVARIPGFRKSPTTDPPKYRALLIGINYMSPAGDNEQRGDKLDGPVDDAKEMKKALIEVYRYKKGDVFLMTDEEYNRDTAHWPSEANIIQALQDLVHDASGGDSFVFFYAGHSGQQPVTTDPNEIDDLDEYIVTCDHKKILDNTLRQCLIDPLPAGTRLTAILDSCHSGTLLDLDHYSCHWFLNRRTQSLHEGKAVTKHEPPRRHTDGIWESQLVRSARVFRTTLACAVTAALAVARFKLRLAKKLKQVEVEAEVPNSADGTTLTTPAGVRRPPCGEYCAYALSNGPLVISLSSCSDQQSTWEDSQRKVKNMTAELIKILRKNPSIKVGDLNQQLKKSLSKMAFKRLREIKDTFKKHSAMMSPEKREEWEEKYTNEGFFEFREQTAQIGSMHRLRMDEQFIVMRARTFDLW
ncbi:caspase domain-containing protein [Lactarius pseudohatsudake]|nr:caspase domain-containing protein [Lactarius pseudohatsudake]